MAAGCAHCTAEADLGRAFQDRDDHHVGDSDRADEQGHRTEAQEHGVVLLRADVDAARMPVVTG
jgi:hypothetical protein